MTKLFTGVFAAMLLMGTGCMGETSGNTAVNAKPAANETAQNTAPQNTAAKDDNAQLKDIVDTAVSAEMFKTLVAAVQAAGLVDTLKGDGPFTVFAPTDEAFAKLPKGTVEDLLKPENKDKLVKILTYHVVSGKVTAADVVKVKSAKTVEGQEVAVKVNDGKIMINDSNVVKTDIMASNGVIHVIDAVLMPAK